MATGRLIANLLESDEFNQIEKYEHFCSYQSYDSQGKQIHIDTLRDSYMCHLRILFKSDNDILNIAETLRILGSDRYERLVADVHKSYGFVEVVIS